MLIVKRVSLFLLLLTVSYTPAVNASGPEQQLVHVVLLWLKEPGNLEHRKQFIDACRKFINIPGVIDLRIGEPVMSDRKIVDDSFDVGLYVTVRDHEALQSYLTHPVHKEAVEIAKPIADKFLVYDFLDTARNN